MSKTIFEARQTHCGQYKPYGDFFRVWDIATEASKESTLDYCFDKLYTRRVPESCEWHMNTGYYTLVAIQGGFIFTICEPFTD